MQEGVKGMATQSGTRVSLLAPRAEDPHFDLPARTTFRLLLAMLLLHAVASLVLFRLQNHQIPYFQSDYGASLRLNTEVMQVPEAQILERAYRNSHNGTTTEYLAGFMTNRFLGVSYDNYRIGTLFTHLVLAVSCFWLAMLLYNRWAGLVAAFLALTMPFYLQQSRIGYEYCLAASLIMLSLAAFERWRQDRTIMKALFAGITFAIGAATEFSTLLPLAILVTWSLVEGRFSLFKRKIIAGLVIVVAIAALGTFLTVFSRHTLYWHDPEYRGYLDRFQYVLRNHVGKPFAILVLAGSVLYLPRALSMKRLLYLLLPVLLYIPIFYDARYLTAIMVLFVLLIPLAAVGFSSAFRWRSFPLLLIPVLIAGLVLYSSRTIRDYRNAELDPLYETFNSHWVDIYKQPPDYTIGSPSTFPLRKAMNEIVQWAGRKIIENSIHGMDRIAVSIYGNGLFGLGYELACLAEEGWIEIEPGNGPDSDFVLCVYTNGVKEPRPPFQGDPAKQPNEYSQILATNVTYVFPATFALFVNHRRFPVRRYYEAPLPAAIFDNQVRLMMVEFSSYDLVAGEVVDVTMNWEILRPVDPRTAGYLHLFLPNGEVQPFFVEFKPESGERFLTTKTRLSIPGDLLEGTYRMGIGLWIPETRRKLWREDLLDCYYRPDTPLRVVRS